MQVAEAERSGSALGRVDLAQARALPRLICSRRQGRCFIHNALKVGRAHQMPQEF
jgi:hypothetical protein